MFLNLTSLNFMFFKLKLYLCGLGIILESQFHGNSFHFSGIITDILEIFPTIRFQFDFLNNLVAYKEYNIEDL